MEKSLLLGTAREASASGTAGNLWLLGTARDALASLTAKEAFASGDCEGSFYF